MPVAYRLTPQLRKKLKKPLGTLVRGSFTRTIDQMGEMADNEKPSCIIAVGDAISKSFEKRNIFPQLSIIDNVIMRKKVAPYALSAERTVYVKNPQGTITDEAIAAIEDSLKIRDKRTQLVIDGEEDLLTLIAVLNAPENAFIVYGQPYEGIVVVKATPEKKSEVASILTAMDDGSKS